LQSPLTLESLRVVLSSDYKGPRAVFSEVHVLRAILAIGAAGSVGRGKLGSLVGLGQGEVRTLIKRLKENDLILIEPDGCKLSKKGQREFSKLKEKVPWSSRVEARSLGIGAECAAVLVRGADRNVRRGIEQRDAAVRVGANGALTALFANGRFTLPGEGTDCERDGPGELWKAARAAGPREGDVLIVVGADSQETADLGTLAAALTVL
jgi:Mn-dependent DtxR family transcriptional regulator